MKQEYTINATQYFTATIYEWQTVLADDNHKDIIVESLQYFYDPVGHETRRGLSGSQHGYRFKKRNTYGG